MNVDFEKKWLSDLPSDWTEKRADFLCDPRRITVDPEAYGDELVAHYSIPQVQETGGPIIEPACDIDSTKLLVDVPTLLVSKLNPRKRTICIAEPHPEHPTLASGEFVAINSNLMDRRYAYYLWCSDKVTDRLSAIVQSATRSHQRVNPTDILKLPWKWPPLDMQQRIAQFLDEKTARIDGLIEKKRELLDRLAEKRQALITGAATKGLNADAPMKPSGIDWLGDIPAHWEVKPLKYISPRVSVGIVVTPAAYYADEGVLAIRGLNVRPMGFDFTESRNISDEGHELHRKSELYEGDLVTVRTGDPGTTSVVTADLEGTNCVDLVIVRRPSSASSRFLGWFLNSAVAKVQYAIGSEGALQLHFNVETAKGLAITVPPNIEEQTAVADYIDRTLGYENDRAAKIELSIDLLEEYRAALISSAVTGQLVNLQ